MQDLVLLVADKNAQFALSGALHRPQAMGIRSIELVFLVHPGRDGGTRKTGARDPQPGGTAFSPCHPGSRS